MILPLVYANGVCMFSSGITTGLELAQYTVVEDTAAGDNEVVIVCAVMSCLRENSEGVFK